MYTAVLLVTAPMAAVMLNGKKARQKGIGYLWAIFCLALLSLGLGHALELYSQSNQRLKEAELLHIGNLYRKAIKDYYWASPGTVKRYPSTLEDLLVDKRLLTTRRYIRKLYIDPVTGQSDWGILRARDGGIIGVYSSSALRPIKQTNFPPNYSDFSGARHYSEWRFTYVADTRAP